MGSIVSESIHISAQPGAVYDLIADVSSVGRLSPEATGALGARERLAVGHTFWGTNRRGPWVWTTHCRVTSADRGRSFAFDVDLGPFPISSWSYEILQVEQGCTVTETWVDRREGKRGTLIRRAGSVLIPGPRDEHNRRNIRQTLEALKAAAESGSTT
jgi:Polyketide cyclase / dehydrase and lipid transport